MIILQRRFGVWIGLMRLRIGPVTGSYEHWMNLWVPLIGGGILRKRTFSIFRERLRSSKPVSYIINHCMAISNQSSKLNVIISESKMRF
jgi:hypothetical protein